MESTPTPISAPTDQQAITEIYRYAATLLFREKRSYTDVMNLLKARGLDEDTAAAVIDNTERHYSSANKAAGKKDMLYGALWCIGGTVLTLAHIGFIFWGAIVFGAIQFFRGVSKL